jgi:hypothetical protein
MAAMPLLNREPETPYIWGLLTILALVMLIAVIRYLPFFLHQVLGLR